MNAWATAGQLILSGAAAGLSGAAARHARQAHLQARRGAANTAAYVDAVLAMHDALDALGLPGPFQSAPGPVPAPAPPPSAALGAAPLAVPAANAPACSSGAHMAGRPRGEAGGPPRAAAGPPGDYVPCACGDDTRPGFHSVQQCPPA